MSLVQIDWNQYFREFCRTHSPDGKYVLYGMNKDTGEGGQLLFADGWRYSREKSNGFEFPPPEDPDKWLELIIEYWKIRTRLSKREYQQAKSDLVDLVRLQQKRSCPIYVVVDTSEEDEFGSERIVKSAQPVDFEDLVRQVQVLKEEWDYCQGQLESASIPQAVEMNFNPAEIMAKLNRMESKREVVLT